VAKAVRREAGARTSAWVVRGLRSGDLVLRRDVRRGPEGRDVTLDEIRIDDGPVLRLTSRSTGGRVEAASPVSTFRYFESDAGRKTVRCNLARLADETDRELLRAVAEYEDLNLEDDGLADEELLVLTLLAVEKRPVNPSPPARRRVPLPEGERDAADLAARARAALAR
jgi:hypothetical protein